MITMAPVRRALAVATVSGLAVTSLAPVALAATVNDFAALAAAFADPSGAGGTASLGADLDQGAAANLTLAAGASLTLDLNGHELTTRMVDLGAGSTLTVTDTAGTPGRLAATTGAGNATEPGIRTTGATLVVEGRAEVAADASGTTCCAGIGGGPGDADGGTVTVRGDASVTARGGQFGAGIGGGDGARGGRVTIAGRATVHAYGNEDGGGSGIGGGDYADGGTVTIEGGADVTAAGLGAGSGIGGGYWGGSGGALAVGGDATVSAHGTDGGAGIGGGTFPWAEPERGGSAGGTVTIGGRARVTALAEPAGAYDSGSGVGGGAYGGKGGTLTVRESASLTARATGNSAGIGGGRGGDGGTATFTGSPAVTAASDGAGAGIGGGQARNGSGGKGGQVKIEGGTVVAGNNRNAGDSSAVGQGDGGTGFGSLRIDAPGTLAIPPDAVLRVLDGVTVPWDGYLRQHAAALPFTTAPEAPAQPKKLPLPAGSEARDGYDDGSGRSARAARPSRPRAVAAARPGEVVNDGAIQLPTSHVDWAKLKVLPHNFLITFDANGGTPTRAVRVFATSFRAGARTVPAHPTWKGHTFLGYNTARDGSGEDVTIGPDTGLSADRTVYAQWKDAPGRLQVRKTASRSAVRVGGKVRYTVTARNGGGSTLTGAAFTDHLASVLRHARLSGAAHASAGTVRRAGRTLVWTGTLAPGATATVTFTVVADHAGRMVNTVRWKGSPGVVRTRTLVTPRHVK
ncbi:DUF7927 domain-containing protein [Actinomadura parmotrematis]|uniref:DUF11 domain-containing protein n=1 Tax=Actinomadura parmotrematis TaxID=2864039 RepID=A0ABS7G522_9ACTN|nr:InlB B-repeat-containing protein [Actinomadura parmotrematis]MBW8487571.1 DUF11 domain-containing protein [Actinomadura parmotrematis]